MASLRRALHLGLGISLLLALFITVGNVFSSSQSTVHILSEGQILSPINYFPLYGQGDFESFPFSIGWRSSGYDWDWVNGEQVSAGGSPTGSIYIKQSSEHVQHGSYSAEFHIGANSTAQPCKLFENQQDRYPASYWNQSQPAAYYSVWYWFPADFEETFGPDIWRLILQWGDAKSDTHFPTVNLAFQDDLDHRLMLCNNNWYRDGSYGSTKWDTGYTVANIPKEQWVHIVAYVRMSSGFRVLDGQITIWINGQEALNRTDIALWNYFSPTYKGVCWGIGDYGTATNPGSIWIDNVQVTNYYPP
jgi:hypothetical protein